MKDPPLEPSEGARPCWHLDLRLPAPNGKKIIFCFLKPSTLWYLLGSGAAGGPQGGRGWVYRRKLQRVTDRKDCGREASRGLELGWVSRVREGDPGQGTFESWQDPGKGHRRDGQGDLR